MKTYSHLIVCNECDTVYRRPSLTPGETARCNECRATLDRASHFNVDHWLALTVAAAIVYVIANVCPVIRIGLRSQHNEATIWQSVAALEHGAAAPIAVPAAMSVIGVPFLQIALLGWVLAYARSGRRAPGFAAAMRLLVALRPWSMVEVALFGILVSVVKLSGFMEVTPGAGAWAMAALMTLITLVTHRDIEQLWDLTEGGARA
ncbi:paraquat-inducible protein A [Paraburkholderia sp. BL10I2N1]|uniref:paraquat-inducible protein A n=1 Tax=Paraburkholderia sp. BL10I2N1 TaxID=1938796 RepID=UPI0010615840|nr:paraquat-inducible protein A [Paraburkholderia sp. BL10I2N1]TDN58945.1 paraquat-inducible protein A [Paraburkholderia sp. BL10I2N1]